MRKFVCFSIDQNPEYIFWLPITCWAWKYFGWESIVFYRGDYTNEFYQLAIKTAAKEYSEPEVWRLPEMAGFKDETIAQISRLYSAAVTRHDDFVMTVDADMIPLSDYWQCEWDKINIFGHNLTEFQHVPICFIGMNKPNWVKVMGKTTDGYPAMIRNDLTDLLPDSHKSGDPIKRWTIDQELITKRLQPFLESAHHVHRDVLRNGYPQGRVDRSAWTLDHPQLIDCHAERTVWDDEAKISRLLALLHKVWPKEDFYWVEIYITHFLVLTLSESAHHA